MRIAHRFGALLKVGLSVVLVGAGSVAASDMPKTASWADAFISGTVTPQEKRAIAAQFLSIREVSREPAKLAKLVTKKLQFSSCNELIGGSRRCTYWDPLFMNGRAMLLTDLSLDTVKRSADVGGEATWQIREGVCVSPKLLVQLLNTVPKRGPAQPGEPIAGVLDEGESLQYVFDEINSSWGRVRVSARAENECMNRVDISLSK